MTESFAQRTLLLPVLDTVSLVDARAEIGGIAAEGDLERCQELVHTGQQRLRPVNQGSASGERKGAQNYAYGVAVAATAG